MPQASDGQRDLMAKWFPEASAPGIDDWPVIQFLEAHGYTFTRGGMIEKPTPSHTVSMFEWECLNFLCDEWDYDYNFCGLSNETASRQPFPLCDVCHTNHMIGVASTSMPISVAYCVECARRGADPEFVFKCWEEDIGDPSRHRNPDGAVTYVDGKYINYRDWYKGRHS